MITFGKLALAAAILATAILPAEATVAVYSGTEMQQDHHAVSGHGSISNGVTRTTGRIYFLYELETGRAVEVRVIGLDYVVRAERKFVRVTTGRGISTGTATVDTYLGDASRTAAQGGGVDAVSSVNWEGVKTYNLAKAPETDPATGLPIVFPRMLNGRHDHASFYQDDESYQSHIRRTNTVSLWIPVTKASNTAGESFDAALQRLKNTLNAQGKTQKPSFNGSLDL